METHHPRSEARWYAVSTRSRQEKAAAARLDNLGIRHFLPLVSEVRRWSDRKKTIESPLFPSYVFVNFEKSSAAQLTILKIPGVVRFVGDGSGPAAIPENEIDGVRSLLSSGIECFPYPFLQAGDRVRILRGPLAGIEGAYVRSGRDSKLVISIEMIQRSLAVDIDGRDIEPIKNTEARPQRCRPSNRLSEGAEADGSEERA